LGKLKEGKAGFLIFLSPTVNRSILFISTPGNIWSKLNTNKKETKKLSTTT
jgi:hypothetical protein